MKTKEKDLAKIKSETTRRPFQRVAKKYRFSEELTTEGTDILQTFYIQQKN